jgi:hypothetical protein
MTCRPVARLNRMPRTNWVRESNRGQIQVGVHAKEFAYFILGSRETSESISERWRRARFDNPRCLHPERCLNGRFQRPHEPTPHESGRRWAPPQSALLACAERWLRHSPQIHAVRAGQMVEAFRHAPRTGLGAPTTALFGKTCHQRLRIALGRVEVVLQIRDVKRAYVHAPYCIVWRCGLSIL